MGDGIGQLLDFALSTSSTGCGQGEEDFGNQDITEQKTLSVIRNPRDTINAKRTWCGRWRNRRLGMGINDEQRDNAN
jgi:hypothetical protein